MCHLKKTEINFMFCLIRFHLFGFYIKGFGLFRQNYLLIDNIKKM